jgi:hypothetical protein
LLYVQFVVFYNAMKVTGRVQVYRFEHVRLFVFTISAPKVLHPDKYSVKHKMLAETRVDLHVNYLLRLYDFS